MLKDDLWNMGIALEVAEEAYKQDEVPVGAMIVDSGGTVLAKAHNLKEKVHDPCGHAELLAIRAAAQKIENWRLSKASLYVTLEPCPMCLAAMVQARIGRLVFGAYDPKGGALSLGYRLDKDTRLNHNFSVFGGVLHHRCSRLISTFFREKRDQHKYK